MNSRVLGFIRQRKAQLIFLLFLLEFLLLTFLRGIFGEYLSPLVFFLASVFFCYTCVRYFMSRPFPEFTSWKKLPHAGTAAVVFLTGFLLLNGRIKTITKQFAIDPFVSDVIPAVQLYVTRLLNGEWPYADMGDWGKTIVPNYLPMQWLPFTLAEWLHTDYRRIAFDILLLGFLAYFLLLVRLQASFYEVAVKSALPFAVFFLLLHNEPEIAGYTIEPMIIGYYMIMLAGVYSRSTWFRALGLGLCLLSRFSLLFWVPFFLSLIWFEEKPKKAIQLVGILVLAAVVIYVIPFMSQDWLLFFRGQQYYKVAALGEWNQVIGGKPFHLFRGLGFASWFYSFLPFKADIRLTTLQITHLVFSISSVALAAWLYYTRWRGKIDYRYFALISFKFYLAVFYGFIQVPYVYLNSLQVFVSLWLLLPIADEFQAESRKPETRAQAPARV